MKLLEIHYWVTELRKLDKGYGIFLWRDDVGEDLFLSEIVEAIPHDGHFHLMVRGNKPFDTLEVGKASELGARLYGKAKEIALEKSRLYKNLFVDSTIDSKEKI